MSREAWGDPPERQEPPQLCPVCDSEWHAEDCELGQEVARRLKAEDEATRLRADLALAMTERARALAVGDALEQHNDWMRRVLTVVRQYPDFDEGGPLAAAMDQALAGQEPELLPLLERLAACGVEGPNFNSPAT